MTLLFEDCPELAKEFPATAKHRSCRGLCVRQGYGWWLWKSDPLPENPKDGWEVESQPKVYQFLKKFYPEVLI